MAYVIVEYDEEYGGDGNVSIVHKNWFTPRKQDHHISTFIR